MAGKDKLVRGVRVLLGGYDLSGDTRTLNQLDNNAAEVEFTGLSNAVGNFLADRRAVGVRGYQAYMNNTASSGASALMASAPNNHVLSVLIGSGGAEPTVGDMAYILPAVQLADPVEFSTKAGLFATDFLLNANVVDSGFGNPLTINGVLAHAVALTATGNGTTVDNGAATTAGAHATIHVTVSSGGTWSFLIQASTSGSFAGEETTLLTFAATGGSVTGEWKSVSGTIPRYLRYRAVRTSGTCTVSIIIARN